MARATRLTAAAGVYAARLRASHAAAHEQIVADRQQLEAELASLRQRALADDDDRVIDLNSPATANTISK